MFFAFAISAFRTRIAYRSQVWALLFGVALEIFARVSIWTAVYGGSSVINGVSLWQMVTYSVLAVALFSDWDSIELVRDVGASIRSGDIVNQLLKPYAYPASLFARTVGSKLSQVLLIGLPLIAVIAFAFGLVPPASLGHALFFALLCLVSAAMIMAVGIVFGLLSFWVLDAHALEWFMRGFVAFLSGGFVPLWFFPPALSQIVALLPFSWIAYHPMAVYLGQVDLPGAGLTLLGGLAWLAVMVGVIGWLWSRTTGRLVVQGG